MQDTVSIEASNQVVALNFSLLDTLIWLFVNLYSIINLPLLVGPPFSTVQHYCIRILFNYLRRINAIFA